MDSQCLLLSKFPASLTPIPSQTHTPWPRPHTVFPSTSFLFLIILHISAHFLQEAFYDLLNYNACSSVLGRLQPEEQNWIYIICIHTCMHAHRHIHVHIYTYVYGTCRIQSYIWELCIYAHMHTHTHTHRIGFHHCRERLRKPRQAVRKGR